MIKGVVFLSLTHQPLFSIFGDKKNDGRSCGATSAVFVLRASVSFEIKVLAADSSILKIALMLFEITLPWYQVGSQSRKGVQRSSVRVMPGHGRTAANFSPRPKMSEFGLWGLDLTSDSFSYKLFKYAMF